MWRATPAPLARVAKRLAPGLAARPDGPILIGEDPPWVSPNVWRVLIEHLAPKDFPHVAEIGTGSSTMWHPRELTKRGGAYTGIESDSDWHQNVVDAITDWCRSRALRLDARIGASGPAQSDAVLTIGEEPPPCRARLLLRSGAAYVSALDCKADLIVVDGKLRTDCVERVLGSQLLKPGGMLVLSGAIDLVLEEDGEERLVGLKSGQACIVPRNVWHTARVREPGNALNITRGAGTEHRPVSS